MLCVPPHKYTHKKTVDSHGPKPGAANNWFPRCVEKPFRRVSWTKSRMFPSRNHFASSGHSSKGGVQRGGMGETHPPSWMSLRGLWVCCVFLGWGEYEQQIVLRYFEYWKTTFGGFWILEDFKKFGVSVYQFLCQFVPTPPVKPQLGSHFTLAITLTSETMRILPFLIPLTLTSKLVKPFILYHFITYPHQETSIYQFI